MICTKTVSLYGREFIKGEKYPSFSSYVRRRITASQVKDYFMSEKDYIKATKKTKKIIEKETTDGR